tara:strand:- start:19 stop:255 length:237 start_codon:yes stop_codon:yes gene_type:complete
MLMPIWTSLDKELRFTDMGEGFIAVNIFSEEFIVGIMLTEDELHSLCCSLAEHCGMPLFIKQHSDGNKHDKADDNLSP